MDSRIEQLLEKYWNCDTTLEEEAELRDFFTQEEGSTEMKETADLFRFFDQQKKLSIQDGNFDRNLKQKINAASPKGKSVKMLFRVARIAAGVIVLVAAGYLVRQEVRKSYPPEIADTYTDPKVAFEETKKALMMISKGFGRAQKEAEKIKVFNEAEQKIQNGEKETSEQKKSSI